VSLHVFADHAEQVGERLEQHNVNYRSCETRLKSRRDRVSSFAGYRFMREDAEIEATVFPVDGLRQAPISPIDGKPMKRADVRAVEELLK
jgi:DNA anti-recombination protein RmuC